MFLRICFAFFVMSAWAKAQTPFLNLWLATPPGPEAKIDGPERDLTKPEDKLIAGRKIIKLGHVSTPQMQVYLPPKDKANGGAVLVCPGGGFSILAWDLEGTEVAEWLNSIGFAAIVVKYRVPTRDHGDALNDAGNAPMKAVGPVMDAQRAMSLTRSKATEWAIDPHRIGITGFSAGSETPGSQPFWALDGSTRRWMRAMSTPALRTLPCRSTPAAFMTSRAVD
jgi:acetyl esterase/lipase